MKASECVLEEQQYGKRTFTENKKKRLPFITSQNWNVGQVQREAVPSLLPSCTDEVYLLGKM